MSPGESDCVCLLCRPIQGDAQARPAREAAWADKVTATVREHGWMVALIPGDEHGPAFAYTIGLHHTLHRSTAASPAPNYRALES
jgi:hypothetical protein